MPLTPAALLAGLLLQAAAGPGPVHVLVDTGARREGLPVVAPHPEPAPYLEVLTRGYNGRVARLYAMAQRFVRPDRPPQPAILVLTDEQGGFPRWGLYRDAAEPATGYVDLHRNKRPSGHAGAIDQIFPHELLHIIVRDLAGTPHDAPSNQMHALGVTTDRQTAFNEGFAEHVQAMAIDDPDAAPATRAIADEAVRARTLRQFDGYRDAVSARVRIAPGPRMLFPLWYNQAEQVLRYHAVRGNLYAHEADIPRRLYASARAYDAYLLENLLPAGPSGRRRPLGRLLATEGAVASLFYHFVLDRTLQRAYRDDAFYAQFGTTPLSVDPLDNVYLKLFAAIRQGGYDTAAVLDAYGRLFPDERGAVQRVVQAVFATEGLAAPPEIWVRNDAFTVGTSLFDQFRGAPRAHAFDLNAASRADLTSVPGVDLELADAILRGGPYELVDDLRDVRGMRPDVHARFTAMRAAVVAPSVTREQEEQAFSFRAVLMPYARRALVVWGMAALAGAVLYRLARRVPLWRVVLNAAAASLVALLAGWIVSPAPAMAALAAAVVVFGVPAAFIRLLRTRSWRDAARVATAWAFAAVPSAFIVTPLF